MFIKCLIMCQVYIILPNTKAKVILLLSFLDEETMAQRVGDLTQGLTVSVIESGANQWAV